MAITVVVVIAKALFYLLIVVLSEDLVLISNATLLEASKTAIIALALMIVAIPEGLPLAVSIAMSLSINNLKNEKILIKNMEGVQTCAMLHDVCVGKTGTITSGEMHVVAFHVGQSEQAETNPRGTAYFNDQFELQGELKNLIKDSIVANSDVRIETNDTDVSVNNPPTFEPHGGDLEVGMMTFLVDNKEQIMDLFIDRNRLSKKLCAIAFDQSLKRNAIVREIPLQEEAAEAEVGIYVKGAPEYVIPLCT